MTEKAKTIKVELTEQDSAVIRVSLELRRMHFPPGDPKDAKALDRMINRMRDLHNGAFLEKGGN